MRGAIFFITANCTLTWRIHFYYLLCDTIQTSYCLDVFGNTSLGAHSRTRNGNTVINGCKFEDTELQITLYIVLLITGGKFVVTDQKIAGRNKAPLNLHSKQSRKLARSCFS
jgi:hypothetical protein